MIVKKFSLKHHTVFIHVSVPPFQSQNKFEVKAQLLGYGNPVTHRISENRINFASRIPTVYAGDLIKTFSKSVTSFSQATLIKSDALGLDGYWNAFPVKLLPEGFALFLLIF